jgi:hypothetical protein
MQPLAAGRDLEPAEKEVEAGGRRLGSRMRVKTGSSFGVVPTRSIIG